MGKFHGEIPSSVLSWIREQRVFWVATAPLSSEGHINVSPKGVSGTFHAVDSKKVWYEDLTGSGNETISHLRENGRITILFTAFEGPPRIARLFGTGVAHEFGTAEYDNYIPEGKRQPGSRAVVVIDIHKVGTSCGWGVPYYQFLSQRPTLTNFSGQVEKDMEARQMQKFWNQLNTQSIDGLPGLTAALETVKEISNSWTGRQHLKRKGGNPVISDISQPSQQVQETPKLWADSRLFIGIVLGLLLGSLLRMGNIRLI